MFAFLGLDYSHHVEKIILESSSTENPMELSSKKVHDVKLDSRASMANWKKRLTEDEIARVREVTEEASKLFYTDEEWS